MKGKPTEREFYDAASYYVSENIELDDALIYVNKAIEMNGDAPFYYIHKKANILKALGKNKEAIDAAKLSLEKSKKAGNNDYVRMNEALIKELSKQFFFYKIERVPFLKGPVFFVFMDYYTLPDSFVFVVMKTETNSHFIIS